MPFDKLPAELLLHVSACIHELIVDDAEQLLLSAQHCVEHLRGASLARHVRTLSVQGRPSDQQIRSATVGRTPEASYRLSSEQPQPVRATDEYNLERESGETGSEMMSACQRDLDWMPIAQLIDRLPGLCDFEFNLHSQLPECVLNALHRHQNRLRLHILNFRLRTLRGETISAHEMALATSPCLYSLRVQCQPSDLDNDNDWREDTGVEDYNLKAILQMAAGLAPNLRQVCVVRTLWIWKSEFNEAVCRPRQPWKGSLSVGRSPNLLRNQLHELCFYDQARQPMSAEHLGRWADEVGFANLRALVLKMPIASSSLRWLSSESSFPMLEKLKMYIDSASAKGPTNDVYYTAFHEYLLRLPPLTELHVSGCRSSSTLKIMLERHGGSLRSLSLLPTSPFPWLARAEDIDIIGRLCPALEELILAIPRTGGDDREVAIYQALGSLRALRRLSLTLQYRNYCHPDWESELEDEELERCLEPIDRSRYDQLNKDTGRKDSDCEYEIECCIAWMNVALDRNLAEAIFDLITASTGSRHPRLATLDLQVSGGRTVPGGTFELGFEAIMIEICRSWRITRHSNEQRRGEVIVTELNAKERLQLRNAPLYQRGDLVGPTKAVFRQLWPESHAGSDWRQDWCSLPLRIRC